MSIESDIAENTAAIKALTDAVNSLVDIQKQIISKGQRAKRELDKKQAALTKDKTFKPINNHIIKRAMKKITERNPENEIISNIKEITGSDVSKSEKDDFIEDILDYTISISDYDNKDDVSLVGKKTKLTKEQQELLADYIIDKKEKFNNEKRLL